MLDTYTFVVTPTIRDVLTPVPPALLRTDESEVHKVDSVLLPPIRTLPEYPQLEQYAERGTNINIRLDSIVHQFLRAIRPSTPQFETHDLNEILEESVAFLRPEIRDRDIIVELDLDPTLPRLLVDRDQMKQAFYNVIKNAFQAMRAAGILHIRSWQSELYVSVSFNDTGGGISQDQMSKLFQPYFTTKSSGSGLRIVDRPADRSGTRRRDRNREQRRKRHASHDPSAVRRQAHSLIAGPSGRVKSMRGTILIVDDEKPTREGLRQSLEDEFDVYTAGNVEEALKVLDADYIDLVLTDLRLGGEDGMALIEMVLQRPRPPVCMLMTAYGSIATAVEAIKRAPMILSPSP